MQIDKLLSGESKNIEYKVRVPEKSEKYMKSVVAFANTTGGTIIFGIDDKTLEVVGMDEENIFQTVDAITNAISDNCVPVIVPDVYLQTIDDKTLIVVDIAPGPMRPYYIKDQGIMKGTYIRVAGTSRHAEGYILKELILEGENRYFDSEPCKGLKITEKDIHDLCKQMKKIAVEHTADEDARAEIKDVTVNRLLTWGILSEDRNGYIPSNAFALLTGKMPDQPKIQCAVFKGTTRDYFIDRKEFSGPIQKQVDDAYQYVLEKINMGMKLKGIYRQDVYELPVSSVREVIANAVVHRSYMEPGNVQVAIYDDRLEVTSPGALPYRATVEKIRSGYSKLRNEAIANAFSYMKIIEGWGTGIPRIIRQCREYGLKDPEFISTDGDFRVNMYRQSVSEATTSFADQTTDQTVKTDQKTDQTADQTVKTDQSTNQKTDQTVKTDQSTNQKTDQTVKTDQKTVQTTDQSFKKSVSDKEKELLELLERNSGLSQTEIANELGWKKSLVKYYMGRLQKKGILIRVGTGRKGSWKINASDAGTVIKKDSQ